MSSEPAAGFMLVLYYSYISFYKYFPHQTRLALFHPSVSPFSSIDSAKMSVSMVLGAQGLGLGCELEVSFVNLQEMKFNPCLPRDPILAHLNVPNMEPVKCLLNSLKLLDQTQVLLR